MKPLICLPVYAALAAVPFLPAAVSAQSASGGDAAGGSALYRANELSVDFFGTGSIGQQTIDHFSGDRVSHDVRLGLGAGVNYFLTEHWGIGGDIYSESAKHFTIDSGSVNLIFRLPLGDSGLAPYGFGGVGHQFDGVEQWFGQFGVGIEFRFTPNWSLFTDLRYVCAARSDNYGVGRVGVRFAF